MKKIAFGLALCLNLAGVSFADVWGDVPVSNGWDTPAPAAEKPAKKAEPASQPAPVSNGWDTPTPAAEDKTAQPVASPAPQQAAPASDGWDTPAPAPEPAPAPDAKNAEAKPAQQQAKQDSNQAAADKATKKIKDEKKPAKSSSKIKIRWVPVSICAGVAVVGGVLTAVFDSKASNATSEKPRNAVQYKKGYDDAGTYQTLRAVSIGVMAVGIAGVGLTFAF